MDQRELIDAIGRHLDATSELVHWALFLAIVFLWAGLAKQDPISVLGMNVARTQALTVACGFYLVVNVVVSMHFLRIGDILQNITDENFIAALTKLSTHRWAANPFAYFNGGLPSRIHSSLGFGVLIVVWWIGNASLYALSDNAMTPIGLVLQGVFLVIGLGSMQAVQRVLPIVLQRLEALAPALALEVRATVPYRAAFSLLGIGLGALVAYAIIGSSVLSM